MIPLTGSGGLFVREGHLLGLVNSVNTYRGTTVPPKAAQISTDYIGIDQNITEGVFGQLSSWQAVSSSFLSYLKGVGSTTIIQMAADDSRQPNNTFLNAITYLINQMTGASQTVQACAVSSSSSEAGANVGNPVIVTSAYNKSGTFAENSFAESIAGQVTIDAQSGGATPGLETVQFLGQTATTDPLSYLYPLGSGCNITIVMTSAMTQSTGNFANWVRNGNFETFTVPNNPTSWTIDTGTPGVTIKQSTAQFYDGASSLQFVGNSSELTTIHQQYKTYSSAGTVPIAMQPLDQLAVCLFIKVDTTPAAGVLRVALVDQNGNVFGDNFGVPNSFTKNLTTVSTTWLAISGVFRTPAVLPQQISLQISLTTAISSGTNLFIDHLAMCRMTQFYASGPYVAIFSAATNAVKGDSYTVTISNNYGGGFQRGFDRFFGMKALGLQLPSATGGSPTISDSLIS